MELHKIQAADQDMIWKEKTGDEMTDFLVRGERYISIEELAA
jgi:hypothetical protein